MIGLSSSASERLLGLPDTEIADRGDRVAETTAAVAIITKDTTGLAALVEIARGVSVSGSEHTTGLVTSDGVQCSGICDMNVDMRKMDLTRNNHE